MKMLRVVLLSILFFTNYANAIQWPNWINQPFFSNVDNIRNKKVVNHSIGLGYQVGSINAKPGNGVSTEWNNASSVAIVTNATVNLTSRLWLASSGFSSFLFASNSSVVIDGFQNSMPKTFGFNNDMNIVVGYDLLRFEKSDIGIYSGFYNMGINNYASAGNTQTRLQNFFIGGVVGLNLTYYLKSFVMTVFSEMYMTYLMGYQSYQTDSFDLHSTSFSNNSPALGFGLGTSTEISLGDDFWAKPFAKLQMMFANNINSGTYYYSGSGISNSGGLGIVQILTTGLGISWR